MDEEGPLQRMIPEENHGSEGFSLCLEVAHLSYGLQGGKGL
jgi:hypothetical protein